MIDKPRIVHVSADFPDPTGDAKTPAIKSLIELTEGKFENRVLSLSRVGAGYADLAISALKTLGKPELVVERQTFDGGSAVRYRAPPFGILHRTMLLKLGDYLAAEMRDGPAPDLIVGHKLTIEGIAVAHAAQLLGRPYAITIQGNTDTRILKARPDLHPLLRRVFHGAAVVVSFSPWALQAVEAKLGSRVGPSLTIPCPTELDTSMVPRSDGEGLLSVFHLKNYKLKNLSSMAKAMRQLDRQGQGQSLSIVGGGSPDEIRCAQQMVAGIAGIRLEGPLGRQAVAQRMNRSAALVLPSLRETFGLVFIEALFAGCPVIYPAGRAIDGYFDGLPFAIAVPPNDIGALASAMTHVVERRAELKQSLAQWQASEASARFTRVAIARNYAGALEQALKTPSVAGMLQSVTHNPEGHQ